MNQGLVSHSRASAACAIVLLVIACTVICAPAVFSARRVVASGLISQDKKSDQDKAKDDKAKLSDGESKAVKKINSATDATAKLQAATEFVNKYPKSTIRGQIAQVIAKQIADLKDPAQKITLSESYLGVFTEAGEDEFIIPVVIDAYLAANRLDDAFQTAATWIGRHPDDVSVRTVLAITGTNEARRNQTKYAQQSQQFGLKAIELIEADTKPAAMEAAQWAEAKKSLPQLYQAMGILSLAGGKADDAKAKFEKAALLNPSDPIAFALLGNIQNDQYQQMAKQFQAMPAGTERDEFVKKVNAQLDQVIDSYARAIALADGNAQLQQFRDQLTQDLQNYYKYRHNNSTDGMQQLIDKYKKPSNPR